MKHSQLAKMCNGGGHNPVGFVILTKTQTGKNIR